MLQNRVRTGELDREITFIKKVISDNTYNEDAEISWVPVDSYPTVFAKVFERARNRGNEEVVADRIASVMVTVFTVRFRQDITTEQNRIVYNGRPYNIVYISEGAVRRETLDITAELIDNEVWT